MGSKTRAKFKCVEITKSEGWDKAQAPFNYVAKLLPVTSGSPENDAFFLWTPSGSIELKTLRDDHFQVGQFYYVDFTPAALGAPASPAS